MEIKEEVKMSDITTLKVGGFADYFCIVESVDDLIEALTFSVQRRIPVFVFGQGSNVLVSDLGFRGLVVKNHIKGKSWIDKEDRFEVKVGAGESWDGLVEETVSKGLWGLENLSGIPGTVGASPVQNIGAYGEEVKKYIHSVDTIYIDSLKNRTFSNEECHFGYRDSFFKTEEGRKYIITNVTFILSKEGKANIEYKDLKDRFVTEEGKEISPSDIRDAVLDIRSRKFPDLKYVGTAGSFFKNPIISQEKFNELKIKYPELPGFPVPSVKGQMSHVKLSLAWILDKICGLKGFTENGVSLFANQPLVLVNNGNAGAEEIEMFAKKIEKKVFEETKIKIEREVLSV